jgi:DNA invertase Pin-like site-specific DNA recombinase
MTNQPHRPTHPVFYGRTNCRGRQAERDLSVQYRACTRAARRLGAAITVAFYDACDPVTTTGRLDASSGLEQRRGGIAGLFAAVQNGTPRLDGVVCASADRLPRRPEQRNPVLVAADEHGLAILFADDAQTTADAFGRAHQSVRLVLAPTGVGDGR